MRWVVGTKPRSIEGNSSGAGVACSFRHGLVGPWKVVKTSWEGRVGSWNGWSWALERERVGWSWKVLG